MSRDVEKRAPNMSVSRRYTLAAIGLSAALISGCGGNFGEVDDEPTAQQRQPMKGERRKIGRGGKFVAQLTPQIAAAIRKFERLHPRKGYHDKSASGDALFAYLKAEGFDVGRSTVARWRKGLNDGTLTPTRETEPVAAAAGGHEVRFSTGFSPEYGARINELLEQKPTTTHREIMAYLMLTLRLKVCRQTIDNWMRDRMPIWWEQNGKTADQIAHIQQVRREALAESRVWRLHGGAPGTAAASAALPSSAAVTMADSEAVASSDVGPITAAIPGSPVTSSVAPDLDMLLDGASGLADLDGEFFDWPFGLTNAELMAELRDFDLSLFQ